MREPSGRRKLPPPIAFGRGKHLLVVDADIFQRKCRQLASISVISQTNVQGGQQWV
jgi:hypothetical protein